MSQATNYMKVVADVKLKKADHDAKCPYRGRAVEVHFNSADMERLGIEEGEVIHDLTARADEKLAVGRMRVYCDIELGGAAPAERAQSTQHTHTRRTIQTPVRQPVEA